MANVTQWFTACTPGGGQATADPPADVSAGVPASTLIGWGTGDLVFASPASFATWKGWGFAGYMTRMANSFLSRVDGGSPTLGNSQQFKTSGGQVTAGGNVVTASGDASAIYDWQRAHEGVGVASINGSNANLGLFKTIQSDPSIQGYLGVNLNTTEVIAPTGSSGTPPVGTTLRNTYNGPPFGDWWSDSRWSAVCGAVANRAAGCEFLGGTGLTFDMEDRSSGANNWNAGTGFVYANTSQVDDYGIPGGGHTLVEMMAKIEQRGYEFGVAIFDQMPAAKILVYSWKTPYSWYDEVILKIRTTAGLPDAALSEAATHPRTMFMYGMLRALAAYPLASIYQIDAFWYRGTTQYTGQSNVAFALEWNTQAALARMSQTLGTTALNGGFPRFYITPFSWAGQSGSDPTGGQQSEPGYSNSQALNRLWGMGGLRAEYLYNGSPGAASSSNSINYPGNDYGAVTGRTAGLQAAASTTSHDSTTPTLSASKSGTGSTRTIVGSASHPYGIHYVEAYIAPAGTPVVATMTWNKAGATTTSANLDATSQSYTVTLTGVSSGQSAIVTAYSTLGQQKSTVVSL